MKIEITKAQLKAVIDMKDDMDAMIGGADNDEAWTNNVRLINRMLKKNNISEVIAQVKELEICNLARDFSEEYPVSEFTLVRLVSHVYKLKEKYPDVSIKTVCRLLIERSIEKGTDIITEFYVYAIAKYKFQAFINIKP